MGDRHGGRFARRGRALSPLRPRVDAHRGVRFRWRAVNFRWRGVVVRICPHARTRPSAKASRHGARAKGFALRRNALLGEGLPTRLTSERICPAQEHAPRRRPPDTAHQRKDLPAQERSPRRRPPDTAHERKDLPSGVRIRSACRRTAGRSRPTNSRKNTPSAGSHPRRRGRCRVHSH